MKRNDVDLIHSILSGDDSAFSELVQRYQKQVHALAWRKIGDFHIAEEITQDTFLKVYQRLSTLKKPHRFAGWLYVIATHCCQDWLRKKQISAETLENFNSEDLQPEAYSRYVAEQQEKTNVEEQRKVVKKLLSTLPESERTVITLYYFGEMTCEKISEFLGVSTNTIKSRLRRARNRLKNEEAMIREAITHFQISPTLTENIMQEVSRLEPTTPAASKPLIPWAIGASSVVFIVLLLGFGSQYLGLFQKPYSLEAQTETIVELVDAQVIQNLDADPNVLNQLNQQNADRHGRENADDEKSNQASGDIGDYTRWNLPEGAKRKFGKGRITDIQLSPDSTRIAIADTGGIWLYDVESGDEIARLTEHTRKTEQAMPRVLFSPDGKSFASTGYDNIIRIYETKSGKNLFTLNMPIGPARLFEFKKDGSWSTNIISADEVESFRFIPNAKTRSMEIQGGRHLQSIKYLPDGKTLVIQNSNGTIWLWDINTGEQIATFSPNLPVPDLDTYQTLMQLEKLPVPARWTLATNAFVNTTVGGIHVIIAFAIGDKNGTISIRDGHTDRQISTLSREDQSKKNDVPGVDLPIVDRVKRPGTVRQIPNKLPHDWVKWITKIEFSPDGKTLVSWSHHRIVDRLNGKWSARQGPTELWDVASGNRLGILPPYEMRWSDVDVLFTQDGKTLAINGSGGCAIWDITTQSEIALFQGELDVIFSGNSRQFALIKNEEMAIWDITTQSEIASINTVPGQYSFKQKNSAFFRQKPNHTAISWSGDIIAALDQFGSVDLWQSKKSSELRTLTTSYTYPFTTLAFSSDGKTLASGDGSGNIQIWDRNTGTVKTTLTSPTKKYIGGLTFSTDNATLMSESIGIIEEWNITTGKTVNTYTIQGAAAHEVSGADSHNSVSSADYIFSIPTGVTTLTPFGGKIAGHIWSPPGKMTRDSGTFKVWDIPTSELLCTVIDETFIFRTLAFTYNGKTFATYGNGGVSLWNTHTGEKLTTFNIPKDLNPVNKHALTPNIYAGAFTPDSKILAVGGSYKNHSLFLWDIVNQSSIAILKGHEYPVCRMAFSPDNTILASGDAGGDIHLWSMQDFRHLAKFKSPGGYINTIVFSTDSKTFATTNGHAGSYSLIDQGGIIYLWDVPSK